MAYISSTTFDAALRDVHPTEHGDRILASFYGACLQFTVAEWRAFVAAGNAVADEIEAKSKDAQCTT